jgi:hypothetical protein
MKKILLSSLIFFSLTSIAGCSYSKPDQSVEQIPPKTEEVIKPLTVKVEVVCIDKVTKDGKPVFNKDGKRAQDCKSMKVREKLITKPPERN